MICPPNTSMDVGTIARFVDLKFLENRLGKLNSEFNPWIQRCIDRLRAQVARDLKAERSNEGRDIVRDALKEARKRDPS
jgi:hypothetical protein